MPLNFPWNSELSDTCGSIHVQSLSSVTRVNIFIVTSRETLCQHSTLSSLWTWIHTLATTKFNIEIVNEGMPIFHSVGTVLWNFWWSIRLNTGEPLSILVASLMSPVASLVTTDRCSNVSMCLRISTKCFLFPGIVPLLYSVGNKTYYYLLLILRVHLVNQRRWNDPQFDIS